MNKKNPFRLRSCVWEITLACCFSCRYCGSRAGAARENELSTAECLSVARQLAEIGCKRVSMIGGEVFMRPDWRELTAGLTSRGVSVNIITNGFLFNETLIDDLKRLKIESVSVSLDGTSEIHDSYRQKGSFDRAVRAIDALGKSGIPVSVITTLHSKNVICLEEMYFLLRNKNIFAWQLQACSPMGNADDLSVDFSFSDVISFVQRHSCEAPFALGIADNIGYYTGEEGYLRGSLSGNAVFSGCGAGLTSIGIDSAGNVRGCESMYDERFIEGNLREKSLEEIWNGENAFAYNRKFTPSLLEGKCAVCEYASRCAAGCRSYNYFTTGKLYESLRCARNENMQK